MGTVIWKVSIDDDAAGTIQKHSGADSLHEAVGYAIWRQSRFANTLREDLPGWEPGIVLSDGIFRSLTSQGGMRRLPGATFEPLVPYGLPLREVIRQWFQKLMGVAPATVNLPLGSKKGAFIRGLLYAATDLNHPTEVPPRAIKRRPLMELVLFGPSPEEARCICSVVHGKPGWDCKDEFRVSIDKLLHDPVSVAEIRGHLKQNPVSAVVLSAGIVGCAHGRAPRIPCAQCPTWATESATSR